MAPSLPGMPAAFYVDVDSKFAAFVHMFNGALRSCQPMVGALEVFLDRFLIDGNASFTTGDDTDARD